MADKPTPSQQSNSPEGRKRGPGRPAFEPTPEQRKAVLMLAGFGVPQKGICTAVRDKDGKPISEDTLAKYFREELDRGVTEANAKVAGSLFKNATENNNVAAQIFWLKTRARWQETPQQIAQTDADGNPVKPMSLADLYQIMSGAQVPPAAGEGDDGGA